MKRILVFFTVACLILAVSGIALADYGRDDHRYYGYVGGNDRVYDQGELTVKVHKMAKVNFLEYTADDINFWTLDRASDTDRFKFKVESNCQIDGQFKGYQFKNRDGALETGYKAIGSGYGSNRYEYASSHNPAVIDLSFGRDGGVWEKEFEVKASIAERQKAGTYNADVYLYVWAD
jgi:hypothetical protein